MKLKRINGDVIDEGENFIDLVVKNKKNLNGANLDGANLDGASLYLANLYRANLNYANLIGANLDGANLYRASLDGASLDGASLNGASLIGANLYRANLYRANLDYAILDSANLIGANLYRASLYRASLYRAKRGKWVLKSNPIQITGLNYSVIIFDEHMEIGCEAHSFEDWIGFDNEAILEMDGRESARFWSDNKDLLISFCEKKRKECK